MTVRPKCSFIFNIKDKHGLSLLTKLRVEFSYLREHRFRHKFNCNSPECLCDNGTESNSHYVLQCTRFRLQRATLLQSIRDIDPNIINFHIQNLTHTLLFGCDTVSADKNIKILANAFIILEFLFVLQVILFLFFSSNSAFWIIDKFLLCRW